MERAAARLFAQRVQVLAAAVANGTVISDEVRRELQARGFDQEPHTDIDPKLIRTMQLELCDLEETAAAVLRDPSQLANFHIITSDPSGPSNNPLAPDFNRLEPVIRIDVRERPKLWEWPDGKLEKITIVEYEAVGDSYDVDGRSVQDSCRSGPEGFLKDGSKVRQYGAATALLKRLLEADRAGAV